VRLDRNTPRQAWRWASSLTGPTIKAALFLGFGLICATWLFAGYYFSRRIADLQSRSTAINERYMRAQDLLTTVRGQVLVGSVYVRDALLDPDPGSAADYRARLEETYRTAEQAVQQYVPVIDTPTERERMAHLRAEIDDFRSAVLQVLATDSSRWIVEARGLLRGRIMPKREGVIRVAEEVQALNRSAFVQQQNEIATIYGTTQRRLWEAFGLAVFVSLGISLLAIVYVGRLEGRIQRQRLTEIENAQDLQRLSSRLVTAQEEERRAIARELHDEVGQALTAIKVELAVAQHTIETAGGPPHVLEDARSITDGALHTVRDLSHLLHPSLLDDLGLAAAIEWYVKGFGKRHGIRVDLLIDRMHERLAPETEVAAYRIAQEALTNVAKHARATLCRVYLQRLPNTLLLTVEDDGVGFDLHGTGGAHGYRLGLIGIRERTSQLDGTLRLESTPGKGTRVTVELPARPRCSTPEANEVEAAPVMEHSAVFDG
jgi:signal transduction histidine kinase